MSIPEAILKQARASGKLNLSNRQLSSVPSAVWTIADSPDTPNGPSSASFAASLDGPANGEAWWDVVPLKVLNLSGNALEALPDDGLCRLEDLEVLDLQHNELIRLANAIGALTQLARLSLAHNHLVTLPDDVRHLSVLKYLDVSHNKLVDADAVGLLSALELLDLSSNALTRWPDALPASLRTLRASKNRFTHLPLLPANLTELTVCECNIGGSVDLSSLTAAVRIDLHQNRIESVVLPRASSVLKELHLGENQLKQLDGAALAALTAIAVLDVHGNRLTSLPEQIASVKSLLRVDASNNDLSRVPAHLGLLPLNSLVLSGNPLRDIRPSILAQGTEALLAFLRKKLPASEQTAVAPTLAFSVATTPAGATTLTLCNHKSALSAIPDTLWNALPVDVRVTDIDLHGNTLTLVPPPILHAPLSSHLARLNLSNNRLTRLPDAEFSALASTLVELNVANNALTALPSALTACTVLETLVVADNRIDTIDLAILSALPSLSLLDMTNNSIASVPPELGRLTNLTSLLLTGNAFRTPRPQILQKGTTALLEYLRSRIVA